ncbi:MAG: hypothetical protein KC475_10000 [Cyanobacteria bacterium HKST-UBA03]|nr:hypothetical protein [Cyanobacteria bacterium HKST-UBA03]
MACCRFFLLNTCFALALILAVGGVTDAQAAGSGYRDPLADLIRDLTAEVVDAVSDQGAVVQPAQPLQLPRLGPVDHTGLNQPHAGPMALNTLWLESDGRQRQVVVYAPPPKLGALAVPDQPTAAMPLVLVYHTYQGSPAEMMARTHFNALAQSAGFVVAYPQALDGLWYSQPRAGVADEARDVRFTREVIAYLGQHYPIDRQRVYAVGMSNGGMMVHRLACELGDELAAVATVAATMGEPVYRQCKSHAPMPVFMINGTADPVVQWNGAIGRIGFLFEGDTLVSVPQTVRFWQRHNGCSRHVESRSVAEGVTEQWYDGCKEQGAVRQWVIEGGGHTWPGDARDQDGMDSDKALASLIWKQVFAGSTTHEVNATQRIWTFLKPYRRAASSVRRP